MKPRDRFIEELKKSGCACAYIAGGREVCGADLTDRVVYLGQDLLPDEGGIIGLHELGHLMVPMPKVSLRHLVHSSALVYSLEIAAWEWALERTDPEGLDLYWELRNWAISSYYW